MSVGLQQPVEKGCRPSPCEEAEQASLGHEEPARPVSSPFSHSSKGLWTPNALGKDENVEGVNWAQSCCPSTPLAGGSQVQYQPEQLEVELSAKALGSIPRTTR